MKSVTVLTPTYNRKKNLVDCYNSLINQTKKDFEWIIIDDGSTDDTKGTVDKFLKENKITIKYFNKVNGGKHTALNLGFEKLDSILSIILDSDDTLTFNAIELIIKYYQKYKDKKDICGFSFLKKHSNDTVIGEAYPTNEEVSSFIEMRINKNIAGDKCEVIYSNLLRDYRFPVFNNEKFLGESTMWIQLTLNKSMVFVNESIYVAEYLEGGLSKQGKKLRLSCPNGGMYNSNLCTIKGIRLLYRIKYVILYTTYSIFAKKSYKEAILKSNSKVLFIMLYPISIIVYLYWSKKYRG